VVLAELQGNRNNPEYLLDVEVTAAAMRMHPYRWPVIGWQSDLETMTRDDLWRHYRDWYVPGNATLVIAGDVDADGALDAVRGHFGAKRGASPERPAAIAEPKPDGQRRVVVERPGSTGYLQVVFPAPAFSDERFVPLLVADAALSGGKGINLYSGGFGRSARTTSPLYQALVEPELVVSAGSALLPTEQPYLYGLSATLRDGVEHRRAEDALFATLERLGREPLDEHALRRAKNQVLASMAFESERVTEIAHQLGFYATIASVEAMQAVPAAVEAITADQVLEAAQDAWHPDRSTVGWFVPGGGR
jgi:zinc protease